MLKDDRHTVKDAEGNAKGVRMMRPTCLSNESTTAENWSKVSGRKLEQSERSI